MRIATLRLCQHLWLSRLRSPRRIRVLMVDGTCHALRERERIGERRFALKHTVAPFTKFLYGAKLCHATVI